MQQNPAKRGNGHRGSEDSAAAGAHLGARVIRIATALGAFGVEIVNDVGPVADPLVADLERAVVACLRTHRHLMAEMASVEVQRGDLDYQVIDL